MFRLGWQKFFNRRDGENYEVADFDDSGYITGESVLEVIAEAVNMVVDNYATQELGRLRRAMLHDGYISDEYWTYSFDAEIIEVASMTSFDESCILQSSPYVEKKKTLTVNLDKRTNEFAEKVKLKKRKLLEQLKRELGEVDA